MTITLPIHAPTADLSTQVNGRYPAGIMTAPDRTTAEHKINGTSPRPTPKITRGRQYAGVAIGVALALVIAAPIAMSSQDLVAWARSPLGLGASGAWPYIAFAALDLAAAVCVGMVVYAALWRNERAGIFSLLVWVFAGGSAYFNWRHGVTTPARDDEIFYPAMSLAGPLFLEVTIGKLKRWAGVDQGRYTPPMPHFGWSWLPGVGFRETLSAWTAAARHGISEPQSALAFVRERRAVAGLSPVDALHYAFSALKVVDPYVARLWLQARGVLVDQAAIEAATIGRPMAPFRPPVSAPPALDRPDESTAVDIHAEGLAACISKRDKIRYAFSVVGSYDQPAAIRWLADRDVYVSRSEVHEIARKAISTPTGEFPIMSGPND